MSENKLLLRVKAGSRLYGYATPSSDEDFHEVYERPFESVLPKTALIHSRQSIVEGIDVTQLSFSRFMAVAAAGSHQALDAMFASEPEFDRISALRANFRAGYEVVPRYAHIIAKFAEAGTPRKQRHALRAAFNLQDILAAGRYAPELSKERLEVIAELHVLPSSDFIEQLQRISPVEFTQHIE